MATTDNSDQVPIEIRKYPNRRYYDTARSSYITLQEIRDLIRQGKDVRVIDSKTEQDLTARVLAQIILDLDARKLQIFPLDLLHELIRANDSLVRAFSESFFDHALFMFCESQRLFERYLRLGAGLGMGETDESVPRLSRESEADPSSTEATEDDTSARSTDRKEGASRQPPDEAETPADPESAESESGGPDCPSSSAVA